MPAREDHRHGPERHPQGVRRPRHVHLSPQAVDAPDHRPVRLLRAGTAELEHHLHLGIPHARGGIDGGGGDRAHAEPRHRLCRGGAGGRPVGRRLRSAGLLLFRVPYGLLRRGGQVPCGAPDVGPHHARPLSREGSALAGVEVPYPDRRGDADRATASEQHRSDHARGVERRPRRHPVAAHECI